jgi:putative FmdB family regulatory protein
MPVYTYRCESCGIQFERHQTFTDKPLTRCPECSKKSLRKVISPVRVVFKGSGFYATDHKSPSGQKHASASKSEKHQEDSSSKTEESKETTSKKSEDKKESVSAKSSAETSE